MADNSSFMDWSPATPEPPFNPYGVNYMPGGWPLDPPPPTAGFFARVRPEGFLPKAKRVCFGLATASKKLASVVTVPIYCVVRQVRQQQKRKPQPRRHVKKNIAPALLLTESPWNRAIAEVGIPEPETQEKRHFQATSSQILPRSQFTRSNPPHPKKTYLYTIPDLMPKSTKRKYNTEPYTRRVNQKTEITKITPPPDKDASTGDDANSNVNVYTGKTGTLGPLHPGPNARPPTPPSETEAMTVDTKDKDKAHDVQYDSDNSDDYKVTTDTWRPSHQRVHAVRDLNPSLRRSPFTLPRIALSEHLSAQAHNIPPAVTTADGPHPVVTTEEDQKTLNALLTPPPIKGRRPPRSRSPLISAQGDLNIDTPESDISSTCDYSVGNLLVEDGDSAESPVNGAMSSTFTLTSQPSSVPKFVVTGGGSPLKLIDTNTEIATSESEEDVGTMLLNPVDRSTIDASDMEKHIDVETDAQTQRVEVAGQSGQISDPNLVLTKESESTQLDKSPREDELNSTSKTPETETGSENSSTEAAVSQPSPTTPSASRNTSPLGSQESLNQSLETPLSKLAKLTLVEDFNPESPTPKAIRHSAEKEHRVTRAESKRLQLLEEVQHYGIIPLKEEWEQKIQSALRSGHGAYKATDLIRVVPLGSGRGTDNWLNDEVINGYLKLIVAHGKQNDRPTQTPTHHAFVSFFYNNLESKGYDSVKRWATRAKIGGKNLLETDLVFIPINSGMHWTLCVVSGKNKTITHYNSLGGNGQRYVNTVTNWVREELGSSFKESEWTVTASGESPQQANMDDCGVFTITSARQIMLGMTPMSYGAGEIPLQRKRIVAELVNGGLLKEE